MRAFSNIVCTTLLLFMAYGCTSTIEENKEQIESPNTIRLASVRSTDTRTADIKRLEDQLVKQPKDLIVRISLAENYKSLTEQTGSQSDRVKAIEHYLFVEEMGDRNPAVAMAVYPMMLYEIGDDLEDKALNLFQRYPELREGGFAPPAYAKALNLISNNSDEEEILDLLLQAVKSSPGFGYSYLLLSRYHAEKRRALAEAMILHAGRLTDGYPEVIEAAASTLLTDLYKHSCPSPQRDKVKFAVNLHNKLMNLRDDLADRRELAKLYQSLGRYRLELSHRLKIAEKIDDNDSKSDVANSYYFLGDSEKALSALDELNRASSGERSVLSSLAQIHMANRNWTQARGFYSQLVSDSKFFYDVFNLAITSAFLGEETRAQSYFDNQFKKNKTTDWERSLQRYWSKNIDYKTLVSRAKNPCQLTEAHSAAGYAALLDGDEVEAKERFQAVVDLAVYDYIEYPKAVYELKR